MVGSVGNYNATDCLIPDQLSLRISFFLSYGLGASKDRFVGLSVRPSVEKNLKSPNEHNYAEIN